MYVLIHIFYNNIGGNCIETVKKQITQTVHIKTNTYMSIKKEESEEEEEEEEEEIIEEKKVQIYTLHIICLRLHFQINLHIVYTFI